VGWYPESVLWRKEGWVQPVNPVGEARTPENNRREGEMYYSNYIINHSIIPDKRLVQHVAANVVKLLVPVSALRLGAVRALVCVFCIL